MSSPTRWLRDSVRSRPLINLLLLLVSALAVLLAALGPMLVRAVGQSGLRDALDAAGADATALTVTTDLAGTSPALSTEILTRVLTAARQGPGATVWSEPRLYADADANLAWGHGGNESISTVRIPADGCTDYRLAEGRCPAAADEIVLSSDATRASDTRSGSRVTLRPPKTSIASGGPGEVTATVVGIYTPDGGDPTLARPGSPAGTRASVTADPVLMNAPGATALGLHLSVHGRLDLAALDLDQRGQVATSIAAVDAAVLNESRTITVDSGLPRALDAFAAQLRMATVLVLVTELQALLLSVFALSVMLQRIARARTAEWGVGRLRGVPYRRWWASIYAEPAAALLIGAPLGLLGAWATAALVVSRTLRSGTAVEVARWPVLGAALGVTAAFLLALLVVSVPNLRRPLVELIAQRSEAAQPTIVGAVAQSAVVLLAAACVYQLVWGGVLDTGGSQLGLLAPGLLALALALMAVRLAVVLVRRVTRRPPRSLAALVVGRQAARTPSSLNPAVVVAVGVALAVFAGQVHAVSVRNQELRSAAATGADRVLTVAAVSGETLLQAVHSADPDGRSAMAVQEMAAPTDTSVARIVAVDTSRFAAVTSWSPQWADVPDVAAALAPAVPAPITITGTRLTVELRDPHVDVGNTTMASTKPADPALQVTLDRGDRWQTVELGTLGDDATTRTAAIGCDRGCRLVSIGLTSASGAPYLSAKVTLTGIGTDSQPVAESTAWLRDGSRWRSRVGNQVSADPRSRATPTATPAGLTLEAFDTDGGRPAAVLPADALDPLPAVVAPRTQAEPFAGIPGAALGRGLDGEPQLITVVGQADVLPRALDDGVLVDLTAALRLADPAAGARTSEVWLSGSAPADIDKRLTDAGLRIIGDEHRSELADTLLQQPGTQATTASTWLGAIALLVALVAFIGSRVADLARRRPDWRSLRDAGLSQGVVRRLAHREIGLPALLGVLLGLVSGLLGSVLATPRLPLVDLSTPGPPLDLGIAWAPVLLTGVLVTLAVLVAAVVGGAAETHFRDREDQP